MRRAALTRLAAVTGAALLAGLPGPPALGSGVAGSGNPSSCNPTVGGSVSTVAPHPISENVQVDCPMVSGPTGTPYGPPRSQGGQSGAGTPGQPCRYVVYQPVKVEVTASGGAIEHDPNYNGTQYGSLTYPGDLKLIPVTTAEKYDIYIPYLFTGKYDANGFCTVPVGGDGPPGWQLGCPDPEPFGNFVVVGNICWHTEPNAVVRPGGLNPGLILPFLNVNSLVQFINEGSMSSLPDNPNAGLVNLGTCFFITGASFRGLGGAAQSIQQPAFYEMNVSEPVNDGTGRYVFYTFRIKLAYLGPDWDFGDGSGEVDAGLPAPCQGRPADIAVSHTYRKYGTYQVRLVEHFGVTVDEYWSDADGEHHLTLNGLIPPIDRTVGVYVKQVLQEEGVPVGTT